MKSKQIVYTLGYITLFCVALYFVFGILKLSGQGLSSMGFDGNIVEGMKNKKEQEKLDEKLEKFKEFMETMKELYDKAREDIIPSNLDEIKSSIKEGLEMQVEWQTDLLITQAMQSYSKKNSGFSFINKIMAIKGRGSVDEIHQMKKFIKLLDGDDDNSSSSSSSGW